MTDRIEELTRKVRRELAMLAQPQKGDPSPKMLLRETIRLVDALASETDKLYADLDAANARIKELESLNSAYEHTEIDEVLKTNAKLVARIKE